MSKGAAEQKPEHKPEQKKDHPKPEGHEGKKGKGHAPMPGGCTAWGCKSPEKRFSFCDEHYEQFKFGLIKKSGEMVPDYEKKFEHYMAYKAKRGAQKVA
jgi:hypothetical protein